MDVLLYICLFGPYMTQQQLYIHFKLSNVELLSK